MILSQLTDEKIEPTSIHLELRIQGAIQTFKPPFTIKVDIGKIIVGVTFHGIKYRTSWGWCLVLGQRVWRGEGGKKLN